MGDGTSIGRVRGLGSAKEGAHHWLAQRYTAIGNAVLSSWLVLSLLMMPRYDYDSMHEWAMRPLSASLLALLVVCTFWHARLGMQVVIEDYVHGHANRFFCLVVLNCAAVAGIVFGLVCVIRIALGGA